VVPEPKLQSIRFPADMHRAIQELADQDQRSFNWIVIHLLRTHLVESSKSTKKDTTANSVQER